MAGEVSNYTYKGTAELLLAAIQARLAASAYLAGSGAVVDVEHRGDPLGAIAALAAEKIGTVVRVRFEGGSKEGNSQIKQLRRCRVTVRVMCNVLFEAQTTGSDRSAVWVAESIANDLDHWSLQTEVSDQMGTLLLQEENSIAVVTNPQLNAAGVQILDVNFWTSLAFCPAVYGTL